MSAKIKLLVLSDTPNCATGYATVCRNILQGLHATGKYEIVVLGISDHGDFHNYPYQIVALGMDQGEKAARYILQATFDILFIINDLPSLHYLPQLLSLLKEQKKVFKSVFYYPVDGILRSEWYQYLEQVDYKVTFTEYARKSTLEAVPSLGDVAVIPHGCNTKEFFPYPNLEELQPVKDSLFGAQSHKFVFTNINRNQIRKDIPRTIQAFKLVKEQIDDVLLYLHMAKKDLGWDLEEVCKAANLSTTEDVILLNNFNVHQGIPIEFLNLIYNISDCVVSSTLGEGWGLTWTEAMATKTPVIMPNNTAMSEHITPERGYLVDCGSNTNLLYVPPQTMFLQKLTDVEDMARKMIHVYEHREEAAHKADVAYQWVTTNLDWQENIVPHWVEFFEQIKL